MLKARRFAGAIFNYLFLKAGKYKYIIFVLLIFISLYAFISYNTNKSILINTYLLRTPLLKEQSGIRIVLISDLHSGIYGKEQEILIDAIKIAEPDLIILSDDIYDSIISMKGTDLLLSGISGAAPVFYVTGNHEYQSRNIKTIREKLVSYKVNTLSDTYTKVKIRNNEIILAGIEDIKKKIYEKPDYNQIESMEKAFRKLDEIPLYKILIAHRPENIENYKKFSFDLVLSGHTHGGQIIIPNLINGLFAPNQGFFPKYAGGIYTHGKLTHIVSRGLSKKFMLPRIGNPLELVIIELGG